MMTEDSINKKQANLAQEITENYYGTTAARSHRPDTSWYEHASQQKLRRIKPWLPEEKTVRILEIGCGCGELFYGLEKLGYSHLTGIDSCKEELENAQQFVHARFICKDILTFLQNETNTYDLVIAMNVLEHFRKDDLLTVLRGIRDILNPAGILIAMVPNAVSPFGGVTRYWDISHELSFTTNNWFQLAHLSGFESNVQFRECGPVPHGLVSSFRYAMWRLLRLFIRTYLAFEVASSRGGIYTQDMLVKLTASDRPD